MTPCRRLAVCALSLSVVVGSGCGGTAALTRADEVSVASDPPGALVSAAGNPLGVTPLSVRQQDVFPVTYPPDRQGVYGTLKLSKEGCKDHTVRVTNQVIRKGVNVKLDCGSSDLMRREGVASGTHSPTIKERLLRLNELREQGLITEEEYQGIRAKILGEL